MKVTVTHENQEHVVELAGPSSISDVLNRLGIHPSTVLAVYQDSIVPHTSKIEGDIKLELITVSSGG
tara:strand:+ start:101 stop:301 length:201 start_codon:yes stop_codon:yes gene_type:complete